MTTQSLKILLIGNGGREHALAWKLNESPRVEQMHVLPGNSGTETLSKAQNVLNIDVNDHASLAFYSSSCGINLVIPTSEECLVNGLKEAFNKGMLPGELESARL